MLITIVILVGNITGAVGAATGNPAAAIIGNLIASGGLIGRSIDCHRMDSVIYGLLKEHSGF